MKNQASMYELIRIRYGVAASVLIVVLLGLIILALLFFLNYFVAGNQGDWEHSDFMLIWLGGRGLKDGIDLYDPVAWENLHQKYAGDYRDNPIFLYPFPAAFLFLPFGLVPIRLGAALWLLFNELLLIVCFALIMRHSRLKNRPGQLFLFVLIVATYLPMIIVIGSGQYSLLMLIVLLATYALLDSGHDLLAGILSVVLVLRPNTVVFFFPAIFLWALVRRRWNFIIGSAAAGLLILLATEFLRPGWATLWITYTIGNGGKLYTYAPIAPTLGGVLGDIGQGIGTTAVQFVNTITVMALILLGIWVCFKKSASLAYIFSVLITISLCITPYAWNYDHILLLFPLAYVIMNLDNYSKRATRVVWLLLILTYTVFPYVLRYIAIIREKDTLSGLVPFSVLFLLLGLKILKSEPVPILRIVK